MFQCQRCGISGNTQEALDQQLTQIESCQMRPRGPVEGVTCDIEKRLRIIKLCEGQTEIDGWKDMYKLLFPNEPVPGPCKPNLSPLTSRATYLRNSF